MAVREITVAVEKARNDLDYELIQNPRRIKGRGGDAQWPLRELGWNGHRDWGYTILRTVCTPESDDLFPVVIAKLELWIRQYYVHMSRFPLWGEKGEAQHKPDGCVNEEVGRRLRFDILQNARDLDYPPLRHASRQDIEQVCNVFREWAVGFGGDTDLEHQQNPRFCHCLAVDEEALRSLLALSDETPPLRVAVDMAQRRPGFTKLSLIRLSRNLRVQ
ncbi:hypothetical protein PG996_014053 [Apiospora saccharicola]|uniref:Uncharacterized protein n=1 Tax=Apiospora saccharicola TaxID=335842 RepID=A0ABR1TH82_9PEZI